MNPAVLGDASPASAVPVRSAARRWRGTASLATLALVATPFAAAPASAAEADGPVFEGTLAVDGNAAVGSVLTIDQTGGTWTPQPESLGYAWLLSDDAVLDAADVPVADAATESLTLLPEHLGKYVIGTVTGTAAGLTGDPVAAAAVGPVVEGDLAAGTAAVAGTVQVGSRLLARAAGWPEGTTFAYRWVVGGATAGTATTFTPLTTQAGKSLRLDVTGTKAGFGSRTVSSATTTVAKASFSATTVKIIGTVKVGAKVSASTGNFSPKPSKVTYRWKANGKSIYGANSRILTIPSRLHGDRLTVTATAYRDGYTTRSATSASSLVAKPFARTAAPAIKGTARVGSTLTAYRGTWSPSPTSVSYRWLANGKTISGATSRTFKLTSAQYGKRISVQVTGRKHAYVTAARTSASTSVVKWPVGISVPRVTKNPTRSVETVAGRTVTLKVSASGGSLRYQWQRWTPANPKWTNMSGKTSSTLKFTASTSYELNRIRVVVTNMAGRDTSAGTYVWIQSSLSRPFPVEQWFSLWNYNAAFSQSVDDYQGYLAAKVRICAAPGYYVSNDLSVRFVGNNGRVYGDAGMEQGDHLYWGVPLDADGCGWFGVYSNAPQSVRDGGRWRITDRSDGQTYTQYVTYRRGSDFNINSAARTSLGISATGLGLAGPAGVAPQTGFRATVTD
ncbi:hypothetical protein [Promicromonospora sukumoe]|uniref:hypothetical protein n=1 Tax=Promicromonospora sukumoe TaxID=88382 RepID=UPI00035F97F3|nr:hypothetical protein [Promicromonospora sukumoe]